MTLGGHGLPLRSAIIARRRRRLRVLATITASCFLALIAGAIHEVWPRRAEVVADIASSFTTPAPAEVIPAVTASMPTRPVYRHSIVAGGAYSRHEVADAMRKDRVVAAHYQHVDLDKVHATTVTAARAVYVSYRVGDQVYWTKNRVRLSPGETVLTDGDTEIRARCGNLLSDEAQQPVAAQEPPLALLDQSGTEDSGSSTIAGERNPEGLTYVPFLSASTGPGGLGNGIDPAPGAPSGFDAPMWFAGAGGGMSPYLNSSTGTTGTSLAAPLGSGERNPGGGSNGGGSSGSDGSNDHNGDGNGNNRSNGSNGSNGGGSNGGTDDKLTPPIDTAGGNDGDGELPSVPEPTTMLLLGLGLCGAAARAVRASRR